MGRSPLNEVTAQFVSWQPRAGGAQRLHYRPDDLSYTVLERYLACALIAGTQPSRSKKFRDE